MLTVGQRVRIKFGVNRGYYGAVVSVTDGRDHGGEGYYYGVVVGGEHQKPLGYCDYELEAENANTTQLDKTRPIDQRASANREDS